MSKISLIEDVIYGLKLEFGEPVTFTRRRSEVHLDTGQRTNTIDSIFTIENAIALPLNRRAMFLKAIGIQRMGYLEPGQREILIDKSDIPTGKSIKIQDIATIQGHEEAIMKYDDYEVAAILVTQSSQ